MNGRTFGCHFGGRALFLATLIALILGASLSTRTASAGTHHYCSSCVIYAGNIRLATSSLYITNNYVHRLSGPTGTQIGAAAVYTDNWTWSSWTISTSTSVNRFFNGTRPAWGAAYHWGAGNYGFNAHVGF